MSDQVKHECGIALIRLLKPLEFYLGKYGSSIYGLQKLHLLMQKQHNRGQDGAGIASIKLDLKPGSNYIDRIRSNSPTPIKEIFSTAYEAFQELQERNPGRLNDVNWMKENLEFTGELFMGHLRYGTFGKNDITNLHPFVRTNNWMTRNLVLAGNFNMTNVDELFNKLVELGQYPVETSDTVTVLEKIGHFLDEENERLYQKYRSRGMSKRDISLEIARELDVQHILEESSQNWDGGFVITGMFGHGDAFVIRDPSGIRPAYYYADDEVVVATSERPPIQTALGVDASKIKELSPGYALIIKKDGSWREVMCRKPEARKACSFERIYFSRGTDADIYHERKMLGKLLAPQILEEIDHNIRDTVFSFIPNTASVAFRGLVQELNRYCLQVKKELILQLGSEITEEKLNEIFETRIRAEDIAVKDMKLRTFITQDIQREDLVAHIYDVTYGVVRKGIDTLVVVDDSIVRGTTLRNSIIRILDRLGPKHIVIASSAPQIRYPDCYGIDMAKLNDFVAFRATIELLKETHQEKVINEVYRKCKAQVSIPKEAMVNHVKDIYKPFTAKQISDRIARMVTSTEVKAKVSIVYQTIENLHLAIPNHTGDWYFTGDYPTPGGNKVVNRSFINYIEGRDERAY
ncbi:MAG: amidophosphoribosyltransferase [Bacteroidales bacterium]|nr:amidophosphoribosyltransferase [Bacteroidales bacterium]